MNKLIFLLSFSLVSINLNAQTNYIGMGEIAYNDTIEEVKQKITNGYNKNEYEIKIYENEWNLVEYEFNIDISKIETKSNFKELDIFIWDKDENITNYISVFYLGKLVFLYIYGSNPIEKNIYENKAALDKKYGTLSLSQETDRDKIIKYLQSKSIEPSKDIIEIYYAKLAKNYFFNTVKNTIICFLEYYPDFPRKENADKMIKALFISKEFAEKIKWMFIPYIYKS